MQRVVLLGASFAARGGRVSRLLNEVNRDGTVTRGVTGASIRGWVDTLSVVRSGDLVCVLEMGGNGLPPLELIRRVHDRCKALGARDLWIVAESWPASSRVAHDRAQAARLVRSVVAGHAVPVNFSAADVSDDGVHPSQTGAQKIVGALSMHPVAAPLFAAFVATARAAALQAYSPRSDLSGLLRVPPAPGRRPPSGRSHFRADALNRLPLLLPIFKTAAAQQRVPLALLVAISYHESKWDPSLIATTIKEGRRVTGGHGIMQLLPSTAASHPVAGPPITWATRMELLKPQVCIPIGAATLRAAFERRQSWSYAVLVYRAGPATIDAAFQRRTWESLVARFPAHLRAEKLAWYRAQAHAATTRYLPGVKRNVQALLTEHLLD